MRTLVAEDDLDNVGLLENILKKNKHTVKVVPDCTKALQRLRDEKLDWMMPEMDGITLIQRVRDEVDEITGTGGRGRRFFDKTIPIHRCGPGFVRWACTLKLASS
jgi:CheY-like chemotaxis protein